MEKNAVFSSQLTKKEFQNEGVYRPSCLEKHFKLLSPCISVSSIYKVILGFAIPARTGRAGGE